MNRNAPVEPENDRAADVEECSEGMSGQMGNDMHAKMAKDREDNIVSSGFILTPMLYPSL